MSATWDAVECIRIEISDEKNRETWPRVTRIEAISQLQKWLLASKIYAIHTPVCGPHIYVAYFSPRDGVRVRDYLCELLPGPAL